MKISPFRHCNELENRRFHDISTCWYQVSWFQTTLLPVYVMDRVKISLQGRSGYQTNLLVYNHLLFRFTDEADSHAKSLYIMKINNIGLFLIGIGTVYVGWTFLRTGYSVLYKQKVDPLAGYVWLIFGFLICLYAVLKTINKKRK
ncbi:hypothetical protein [Desulfogranum japonicum]|uniref:hypothetical protein n=1 Tax=Desulfogranum japonicum TaxID=231447 RepID=UPI00048A6258|nr:hypothetical protein [Desulfogranum japonicum]